MQRLILGCGKNAEKVDGVTNVDIRAFDCVDVIHDLNQLPWPFADNSYESVIAIHVIEHLNSLLDFMNEAWRILSPGGSLYLETPLAGGDVDLEWADPTHIRCYRIHSFVNYFSPEGVARFGYTDKAWNLFHLKVIDNCIILHAYPVKKG